MLTFLEETLNQIKKKHIDVSSLTFILPSKRAGGFLLNYIKQSTSQTSFAPKIISIEEFVEELSGLKIVDSTKLLFISYEVYLNSHSELEKDNFEVYTSWASTLLNDLNEIDRFLIPPKPFFNYLRSIQDINHWYVREERTSLVENYLKFWNSLYDFYKSLKLSLLNNNMGYQGMVYREAAENIEHYLSGQRDKKHIFIGFNALNKSEQTIFQELLETGNTEIYWDAEAHFYNDNKHSASYFLRKYISEWNFYHDQAPKFICNNFKKEKIINIVEVQKNVGQAKYIGQLLSTLPQKELDKTAIVLADENLLHPLLQSLPNNIKEVNITMGVALKSFPAVVFFEILLSLHLTSSKAYYYKNILAVLNHPITSSLLSNVRGLIDQISNENLTHISFLKLCELNNNNNIKILQLLFDDWEDNSSNAIKSCVTLLLRLKENQTSNRIERVVFYELYAIFKKIESLNNKFEYLETIKTIQNLFSELITITSLDFKGDAYSGLQIMGVLESRVLDFENLILASVNEGIFPLGKSNSSFITYDLKQQFGLPTYSEKDAIYTYHFYRLLHRAKNITLIYNNFSDGLNSGEKSRFISQLEIENIPNHKLLKSIITPKVSVKYSQLKRVIKTKEVMNRLKEIAGKGFSPSALTSYMRNPLDFYYKKILRINDSNEVEETVAANTLGTIVHDTLKAFYKPYEDCLLSIVILEKMQSQINTEIERQFKISYKGGDYTKGGNLIIFEVAKRFVLNFIKYEISEIKKGNQIKILKIESDLALKIQIQELKFPVKIHGQVDRVDEYNGFIRIIDYKTGFVKQSDLEIINWEDITTDYKYSKIIQVLAYAFMINDKIPFTNAQAGIISFKSLSSGFLRFGTKPSVRGPKNQEITQETFDLYLIELKKLILEICNPKIPFIEKEV